MRDNTREKVSGFIRENDLLRSGDRVVVALSGGADSVALLHLLISLKEDLELSVFAAHFNHGIRGEEADCDEAFVTDLCEEYRIRLFVERADVPSVAAQSGESTELCGRRLRYRFLEKVARDLGDAKIATAHHRDDHAETILWNLTRGSGIGGLSGIPARRGDIIRPLLCISRADVEAYCARHHLRFVTDSTNLSDEYTRNKLRHRVMPVLRELNPNVGESIAHTAQVMRYADDYLNKISLSELNKAKTSYGYACDRLLNCEPILLQYAVKNLLENADAPVDFRHIALIIEAMRSGGAVDLGGGFTVSCAQGILRVMKEAVDAYELYMPFSEYVKDHAYRVTVRDGKVIGSVPPIDIDSEKINKLLLHHGIPCDIMTRDAVVRCRRAGDTFTDARRGVTKTLKKLFNELKIPRELRDTIPVVADGSVILWIQGIGTSAQAAADLSREGDYYLIFGGLNHA